jgi:hypothetical protein
MFNFVVSKSALNTSIRGISDYVSALPLDVDENGLDIALLDENRTMGFWLRYSATQEDKMFTSYDFEGDAPERYVILEEDLAKILKGITFPIVLGSLPDKSILVQSTNGRQKYTLKPANDKYPNSGKITREKMTDFMEKANIVVKVLASDLNVALKSVSIAGNDVSIELDNNALIFRATDLTSVDAEAIVPLIEPVDVSWQHQHSIVTFKTFLDTFENNVQVTLYMSDTSDPVLAEAMLGSDSFCRMFIPGSKGSSVENKEVVIQPKKRGRKKKEDIVVEKTVEEDEMEDDKPEEF